MYMASTRHLPKVLGHFRPPAKHVFNNIRTFTSKMEMFQRRLGAEKVGRQFEVSVDELRDVMLRMSRAMEVARQSCSSSVKCWSTYVDYPPVAANAVTKPTDVSRFLGMELTNNEQLRVRLTDVSGPNGVMVRSSTYPVSDISDRNTCTGSELFDYAACYLAKFADRQCVRGAGLPLAFTFGFPVRHTALDAAVLQRWTKRLDCANVVGRDVVAMLRASLDRARVNVGPVALFNDACAVALNGMADVPSTKVGLVVDDGCNCCYVERVANVRGYDLSGQSTARTIVNTEWGAFGEDGALDCILTKYDKSLDARSWNPGKQIFEKLTSGMYVAELVRKTVSDMADKKVLFNGRLTREMFIEHRLRAEHLSQVESDARGTYIAARTVLVDVLKVCDPTDFDCELFRYACDCVTKRSAHLVAAGLAGLLRHLNSEDADGTTTVVAVDGSMFEAHTKYASMVACKTKELTEGCVSFVIRTTADQSRSANLMAGILAGMTSTRPCDV